MNENNRQSHNRTFLKHATVLAETGHCSDILFFRDTFSDRDVMLDWHTDLKLITVTQHASEASRDGSRYTLPVRLFSDGRLRQLRSALLLGLVHGFIKTDEKICCIGGLPTSDRLDTVILLEVQREIQPIFEENNDLLPSEVRPEVFERVLSLATELATEGREGHAVGCLFVLGNVDRLSPYVHPLILNPFFGYAAGDRNILTTAVDETVKEYALLDGAFIINGEKYWLTKPMRESLVTSLDRFQKAGIDNFPFVLGSIQTQLPCNVLDGMITQLEVYATQCMGVTTAHQMAAQALQTEEELLDYDYTNGYPEMLKYTL